MSGRCGRLAAVWDPETYEQFANDRARPFDDLLARVRAQSPSYVVDLGCGPGSRTATLADRWPTARVVGVDNSADMISAAQQLARSGLTFVEADLREWQPERPVDVLTSNAALQWVPGRHLDLLERFAGMLAPGGWLAFQVPGNYADLAHTILAELRTSERWRDRVGEDADRLSTVAAPATYLDRLARLGLSVDVWETTYLHLLPGEDPVLAWMSGSGLRPVFAVLDGDERDEFVAEYRERLRAAYETTPYGTVLPFRRIFAVGRRGG
jgi:trans-aconitate 2-methyltransferase